MPEINKPPLLRSAELKPDNLISLQAEGLDPSKIEDAVELESDVLMLKFMREEMLSMLDEVRPYTSYETVLGSPFFDEENMPMPLAELEQLADREETVLPEDMDEAVAERAKNRIKVLSHKKMLEDMKKENPDVSMVLQFEDDLDLMKEDWKLYAKMLIKNMYRQNLATFSANKEMNQTQANEAAKDKTKGQRRLVLILVKKILHLNERIERILEEGGNQKVLVFIKAIAGKIKEALRNLKNIQEGVKSAKAAKLVTGLYTAEETAGMAQLDIGEIREIEELESEIDEDLFGEKRKNYDQMEQKPGARELHDELGNLVNTDTLTAYVNYSRELRHLHTMLKEGRIVETEFVKDIIEQAMPNLTKNPPTVVYLHGDYGTGKTAIAVHISRTRFKKDPIIVAGNKFLEPDRFTEELKIEKMEPSEFLNEQLRQFGGEGKFEEGDNLGDMITALIGDKETIVKQIAERRKKEQGISKLTKEQTAEIKRMVDSTFENQVQGRYVIGAMYQAMKEGRPLIVDEANAITPEVMIAFNDLMTKQVGDKVRVRSAEKEVEVKKGYCVIWTGNTGGRYKSARYNDVDPAAFSRIAPIRVAYLPQSRYKSDLSATFEERLELDSLSEKFMEENGDIEGFRLGSYKKMKEVAKTDQIFQVLMLKVLNNRLGARLLVKKDDPYSVFKELYRLSTAARTIMDIFEETVEDFPQSIGLVRWIGSDTAATVKSKLRKTNLTMRGLLDKIVAAYLEDGMAMDLEYYVFRFVKELAQMPEEMAIVYTVMKQHGFFMGDGWNEVNSAGNLKEFQDKLGNFDILTLPKYEKVDINGDYVSLLKPAGQEGDYELKYFPSMETMQLVFGYLPPRRLEEYRELAEINQEEQKKSLKLNTMSEKENQIREAFERIKEAFDPKKLYAGQEISESDDLNEEAERVEKELEISNSIREFNKQTKELKIDDHDYMGSLSYEEYLEVAGSFCDMILKVMEGAYVINEAEAAEARSASIEERISMVAALIDKVQNN